MINLSQDVLKSPLWIVDAEASDEWFCYFDWLTQFELSKKKHFQIENHSLFIDKRSLQAEQLLLVRFSRVRPETLSQLWKSLGSPATTIFNSQKDLTNYNIDGRSFIFVTEKP